MSVSLTTDQERLVQSKLQSGKYRSAEKVLEVGLKLLDEYERSDAEWVESVRAKVSAAIEASSAVAPIDGETFINGIIERF